MNAIFKRDTLTFVDTNRMKLPFEVEIKNVDVAGLTKVHKYTELEPKLTEEGKPLFLYQDEPIPTESGTKLELTTEVTDVPYIKVVPKLVPHLDEHGNQKSYQPTQLGKTTEVTDEPVMIASEDGDVQEVDENENPLYWGQVPTGQIIYCHLTEEVEEHQKDSEGNLLYYKEVPNIIPVPRDPEEITDEHPRFTLDLPLVKVEVPKERTVKIEEDPHLFTYDDVVAHKEKQLLVGKIYESVQLYETMDESLFSTELVSFNADLGFDFVSIPPEGEIRTIKLDLKKPSDIVHIYTETSISGLDIAVGATASDLQTLDRNNERLFTEEVSSVYVRFKNSTTSRINLDAFAILTF